MKITSQLHHNYITITLIALLSVTFNTVSMSLYLYNKVMLQKTIAEVLAKEIPDLLKKSKPPVLSKEVMMKRIQMFIRDYFIVTTFTGIGLVISNLVLKKMVLYRIVQSTKNDFIFKAKSYVNERITPNLSEIQKVLIKKYENESVLFIGRGGSGKSTIMMHIGENARKQGSSVFLISGDTIEESWYTKTFGINRFDIFKLIFNTAKNEAEKSGKKSYVLIDEIFHTPFLQGSYKTSFFHYTNSEDFKKSVRIQATTSAEEIDEDVYRPGRLKLELVGQNPQQKHIEMKENYEQLQAEFAYKEEELEITQEEDL